MKARFHEDYFFKLNKLGILLLIALFGFSCTPKDLVISTFEGEMIYSYLKKDTVNDYSEFIKIVDKAGLKGMLSAYGDYTCLAPTNAALQRYYSLKGPKFNFDSLTQGQIDTLAKTHIIPNRFPTYELSNGVITNPNMLNRFIEIKFDSITAEISLNDSSLLVAKDVIVYNGIVHGIDRVLRPANTQIPDLIGNNPNFSIFAEALNVTGLSDSLRLTLDRKYKPTRKILDEYDDYEIINPKERKFGYTVFVEDNELLKKNGIMNLQDLIQRANELYPDGTHGTDYRNRNNSLNKYISYHLVNKMIYYNKFFYTRNAVKNFTPDEFIETMLPYRIMRASKINGKVTLNTGSDRTVQLLEKGSKTCVNGVYHLLDAMLVYTPGVEQMLLNTRMRLDINSLFPEMTNNNIRGSEGVMKTNNGSGDRYGFEEGYLSGVKLGKDTRLIYLASKNNIWANFQADELMGLGAYDVTVRLLPVPPGTYEIRFGYSINPNRSITQLYVDDKPVGIPLNLRMGPKSPLVGALLDAETDDDGYENDKMIRNRGYMKGPTTVLYTSKILRNYIEPTVGTMRRIVGTFTFSDYAAHTLRFKSVESDPTKQCMMDYIEIVPKNVYNRADGEPEDRE